MQVPLKENLIRVLNHQFKILGVDMTFQRMEEEIEIKEGKKVRKVPWYEHYKFENEAQYQEWKVWAIKEMEGKDFDELDMLFGLMYKWKEEL